MQTSSTDENTKMLDSVSWILGQKSSFFFPPFFAEHKRSSNTLISTCLISAASQPHLIIWRKNRSFDAFFMDLNLKAATASSNFEVQSETEAALRQPELTVAPSCT